MATSAARLPVLPPPRGPRGSVIIAQDRCKGCELCIEFCPTGVLARSKDFNAKGYHYPVVTKDECVNCRLCVTVCPEYAIFSVPASAPAADRAEGSAPAAGASGGHV